MTSDAMPAAAAAPTPTTRNEREHAAPSSATATQLETLRTRFAASSLRGSQPDGALELDATGRVIANLALRRLFDWYLSLSGEFSADEIRALLDADLRDTHGAAASDAMALFDTYLDLLRATAALDRRLDAQTYLARQMELRRERFGDTAADAMFGADETAQQHTLDRIAVLSDASLTAAERAALAQDLDDQLPAAERTARELASANVADEQSRRFDSDATDPATRAAERTALFGADAATRLATLDAERAVWDARTAAYRHDRAALDATTTLTADQREEQLESLRNRSFTLPELRRIDALDSIETHPPGG